MTADARATIYLRRLTYMRETYGLALVRPQGAVCPRKVLPFKRCLLQFAGGGGPVCLCDGARAIGMNDHAALWMNRVGGKVWSTEPYDVDAEKLDALRALVAPLGLIVDPRPHSPYNPGETTLILIRAPR